LLPAWVAHHPPHARLGHAPEGVPGLAQVEQPELRVLDPVLDDPLHHRHVQVPGEHLRFLGALGAGAVLRPDLGGPGLDPDPPLRCRWTGTLVTVSMPKGNLTWGPGSVVRTYRPNRCTTPTASGS